MCYSVKNEVLGGKTMSIDTPVKRKGGRPKGHKVVTINPTNPPVKPFGTPESSGYIRVRIREVAVNRGCVVMYGEHRGEANLSAIARGAGLAWTTVNVLANNGNNISGLKLETIARLCAFFQCSPGELLEYVQYEGVGRPPTVATPILNVVDDEEETADIIPLEMGVSKW
jgi:DNA-binding Xre family transcriptional regulator